MVECRYVGYTNYIPKITKIRYHNYFYNYLNYFDKMIDFEVFKSNSLVKLSLKT